MEHPNFDYYYGDESSQFSFYRIPRQLITSPAFKRLCSDAKLLYGLLLDRMGLSARNGWYDGAGRVYIYYTLNEIQEDLNCGHDKAVKLLADLEKGFGLIERVKQGQGKPAKIFVKRFTTRTVPEPQPQSGGPDFWKGDGLTSENPKPWRRESRRAHCEKADANYIKSNQTEFIQTDPSILPSVSGGTGSIDRCDCVESVRERVGYLILRRQYDPDSVDEVVELITDVLCAKRPTVRIGGEDIPAAQVQERFEQLEQQHLEYVFDALRRSTTEIHNIRAYLLTALYNAPVTISHYYQAAVRHDFG